MSLIHIVEKSKTGDEEAVLTVINRFMPKISKCARQLDYEEAKTDLVIALIETIQSIDIKHVKNTDDGSIVMYICNILENKKVDLFRKYVQGRIAELEIDTDIPYEDSKESIDNKIIVENILDMLPAGQKTILQRKYIEGFSDREITQELKISRQAVNRAKNRAFQRIRNTFNERCFKKGEIAFGS